MNLQPISTQHHSSAFCYPAAGNVIQTMSSREIADIVESRHDSVKRTMETLANKGLIQLTQTVEVNHKGQRVGVYHVNKRDSYIVVAQLSPEFTARLVDRWQELEETIKPTLPQTYLEALEHLVIAERDKQEALALIEQQKPKVEYCDRVLESSGLMSLRDAVKSIGYKPIKSLEWLRDKKYLGQGNKPYQKDIEAGRFQLKQVLDRSEKTRTQTMVTPKGAAWLDSLLKNQPELKA